MEFQPVLSSGTAPILESGVIVSAEVCPGDAGDTEESTERVVRAIGTLSEVCGKEHIDQLGRELAGREGCFSMEEIGSQ